MSKATFEERLIAGLKADGWTEDTEDRSRYTAFKKLSMGPRFFVGPNGALRGGKNASSSRSYGDPAHQTAIYKAVLAKGEAVLQVTAEGKVDTKALLGTLGGGNG